MAGRNIFQNAGNFVDDRENLIQHDSQELEEQSFPDENHHSIARRLKRSRDIRMIIIVSIIFSIAITVALVVDIFTGSHHTGHAAVVSDVKECADVGLDLLRKGGSAVDAAIGTMLCVGVMNPESTGIGGGGFMLSVVPQNDGEAAKVIDFREVAPLAASKDMFHGNDSLASWGGLAVGVPGEIRGYELAHKKYGKLKWSELFVSAIKIAREGFTVTEHTGRSLKNLKENVIGTELGKVVAPKGKLLKEGDKMSNPALANTLQKIADHGADAFYKGPIADSLVKAVRSAGGILTKKDLKIYQALEKEAINSTYKGYQVITTPLPSGGPVLISLLNILDGFKFSEEDQDKSQTYHNMIEAMKFAFGQRSLLEDSKNLTDIIQEMLSKKHANLLRAKISPNQTFPLSHYGLMTDQAASHGTAHVSAIGPDGALAAITSSVNGYFGSGIMTKTGILLNNEMLDFSIPGVQRVVGAGPPKANFVAPGKRPLSNMAPTAVLHEERRCWLRTSLGGSGSYHIIPAVANTLINILSFNFPLSEAIEKGRIYYGLTSGKTEIEVKRFPHKKAKELVQVLENIGHNVTNHSSIADVNGLSYFKEEIVAHGDSRRGGAQGSAQY
ncbi:glutathione hydrolase 1 proenzyme-like [Acropora millepora]|uniref:glutathione hydrolase 1 proenzyme-like n=1 Tax=Acropora millepora TaxID=45264 RepID=UPI001CF2D50B|nr:glutathione hydrolase 1 proenzyme-like [Acropora millepora]